MTRRIEAESRKDEERQYKACVDHSLRTTIAELEDPPEQYHLDESVAVLYGASADRRTVILDDAIKSVVSGSRDRGVIGVIRELDQALQERGREAYLEEREKIERAISDGLDAIGQNWREVDDDSYSQEFGIEVATSFGYVAGPQDSNSHSVQVKVRDDGSFITLCVPQLTRDDEGDQTIIYTHKIKKVDDLSDEERDALKKLLELNAVRQIINEAGLNRHAHEKADSDLLPIIGPADVRDVVLLASFIMQYGCGEHAWEHPISGLRKSLIEWSNKLIMAVSIGKRISSHLGNCPSSTAGNKHYLQEAKGIKDVLSDYEWVIKQGPWRVLGSDLAFRRLDIFQGIDDQHKHRILKFLEVPHQLKLLMGADSDDDTNSLSFLLRRWAGINANELLTLIETIVADAPSTQGYQAYDRAGNFVVGENRAAIAFQAQEGPVVRAITSVAVLTALRPWHGDPTKLREFVKFLGGADTNPSYLTEAIRIGEAFYRQITHQEGNDPLL